ncbi:hypothetical protein Pmani_001578 [Petrolisthes manimaculis]|uniref:RING-type domain-containing protein n=1 Tax=Petrolisthes manimaculis TaxID=1843537 RepID=A0AAE1QLX8_9EUCA|nr:hypothetical protein Pmani_001578 [Petrolisthes manimaculis]
MEESDAGCSVCQEQYEEGRRPPRNLGCGHSVCTSCVEQIIIRGGRKCPECRCHIRATTATALPINYPLLRLARALATRGEVTPTPTPTPTENYNDAGECAAHLSRLTQRCMTCRVWVCGECVQVDHNVLPRGECRVVALRQALTLMKHTDVEPVITMCRDLQQLKQVLAGQAGHLENNKKTHEAVLTNLRAVITAEQDIIRDLEGRKKGIMDRVGEVEGWVAALRQAERDISAAATVRQLATAKLAAKESLTTTEARAKREKQRTQAVHIPQSLATPQEIRGLVRLSSNMMVVQEGEGERGRRWGRLSLQDSHLHLYALRNDTPPPPASTPVFSFSGVRGLVPRNSASAFLEVRWDGHQQGKVTIKTQGRTARARQFLQLCSGEAGASYLNTSFFEADRVGGEGAIIRGGDYENNDGTGGAALLEGITDAGDYLKEAAPGLVVGAKSTQRHRLAAFGVILSSWSGHKTDTAFGEVSSGLAILTAATHHSPLTDVVVEDCGLIIPL